MTGAASHHISPLLMGARMSKQFQEAAEKRVGDGKEKRNPFPETELSGDGLSLHFRSNNQNRFQYILVHFLHPTDGVLYIDDEPIRPPGIVHHYKSLDHSHDYIISVGHNDQLISLFNRDVAVGQHTWIRRVRTDPGNPGVGITIVMQDDAVTPFPVTPRT
jgi:hypothetical protein